MNNLFLGAYLWDLKDEKSTKSNKTLETTTEDHNGEYYKLKFSLIFILPVKGQVQDFLKNNFREIYLDPELHLLVIVCVTGVCILLLILVIMVVYYRRKAERNRELQLNRRLKERPFCKFLVVFLAQKNFL